MTPNNPVPDQDAPAETVHALPPGDDATPGERLAAAPDDTCRVVDIDGEPVRVRGSGDMSDESRAALSEVIGAARRRHAAERARHDDRVRAAAFREAADMIDNDDDCGCGGCDSCTARKDAARLRARADEISGHHTQTSGEQA